MKTHFSLDFDFSVKIPAVSPLTELLIATSLTSTASPKNYLYDHCNHNSFYKKTSQLQVQIQLLCYLKSQLQLQLQLPLNINKELQLQLQILKIFVINYISIKLQLQLLQA